MPERKCLNAALSQPCKDKNETLATLARFCSGFRSTVSNVHGEGPLLVSNKPIAKSANNAGVVIGIDEAGRGPLLGPMTYAAAYWYPSDSKYIPSGLTDSKKISAEIRSTLFSKIHSNPHIGFTLRVLHASEISRNMLREDPYNLNAMSHNSAIQMIQAVLDTGVKIDTAYIDTVGRAEPYKSKLDQEFKGYGITFVVEKKADDNYAPCSAASVIAKVSRDSILKEWDWTESLIQPEDGIAGTLLCNTSSTFSKLFGSGYPSDPTCKAWLEKNLVDPVFCFPDIVRFSWGPAKKAIEERGVKVLWEAEEEDVNLNRSDENQKSINSFLIPTGKRRDILGGQKQDGPSQRKKQRFRYFDKKRLNVVTKIIDI